MRVLLVNTYYAPEMVGGAEHSVKKLAEHMHAREIKCAVLCTGARDEDTFVQGVPVIRRRMKKRDRIIELGGAPKLVRLIHEIQNTYCLRNAKVLDEVLQSWKPDVIHTNGIYDISPVIWRFAARRGIPVVHTLRDYSMLCPRVHNMRNGQQCQKPYPWCGIYRMINRLCSRWVKVVTAPSQKTLSLLVQNGFFPKADARVIVNATDVDEHTQEMLSRRALWQGTVFTVAYLGELTEKKGLLWLLDAFSRLQNADLRLVIAGRGALEEKVREAARRDSRIEYRGYLNEDQVGLLLDEAQLLACPSLWEEPFGRVVIDAYKHAMPVIASDRGAFPEIVRQGETGWLIPAKQSDRLGEAIEAYLNDRALWLEHCRNAVQELQKYTMDEQIRAFMAAYRNATGKD